MASVMSALAGLATACVQVDLVSIANTNGQITDYQSAEDELSVWMGVGEDILFTWKNTMTPWQEYKFPDGFVTIPCFNDGVFYIETTEVDEAISDKTQVMIACKNFQLGRNYIVQEVKEDNSNITGFADVVREATGLSFDFGETKYDDDKIAQYTFTFDVSQNCELRSDIRTHVKSWDENGTIRYYGIKDDLIQAKIQAEYVPPPEPEPIPVKELSTKVEATEKPPAEEEATPAANPEPEVQPAVEPVELETGDTVSLETDVANDTFSGFNSFKST